MMSYFKPYMYVSLYENRHTIRRERLTLDRVLYPVWEDTTGRIWNVFPTVEALREFRAHLNEALRIIEALEAAEREGGLDGLEAAMQKDI